MNGRKFAKNLMNEIRQVLQEGGDKLSPFSEAVSIEQHPGDKPLKLHIKILGEMETKNFTLQLIEQKKVR